MSKIDTMASYFMKVTKLCDQVATTGKEVKSEELVHTGLKGFSSFW